MSFQNENVEGDETITIEGPCFLIEEGEMSSVFDDDEIETFLTNAGLADAQP